MAPNQPPETERPSTEDAQPKGILERMHKYLLLLAILAATVTYNAGLTPPGGVWVDDSDGHIAGDPILQARYPARYGVFFYCNATAFVASLVIIVLLLSSSFSFHGYRVRALQAAMLLDLLGLMGAFTAGSCRKVRTSAYVVALVGAVVAYLAAHLVVHFWVRSNRCPSRRQEVVELLNLHRLCLCCFGCGQKEENGAGAQVALRGTSV
ncbi:hypothetical protein HU200_063840 [Digitaria exilis]|uniref:PGG domain-containing protein n=1 Tax=Digitaria exilis TaxID=1010633 RepID=A0A835DYN1_9POAL|nr:hypothetical protein HU200_063840 [Digitaria exilis]CAB3470321.1 unnamed protein product [Digitaria exilis]